MTTNTKIEWADHTFNPWIGCTRVSTAETAGGGCDGCYAAVSTPARVMKVVWGAHEPRHRTAPSTWAQPAAWNRKHEAFFAQHGRRQQVFCASLADVFDNAVPTQWRADLFQLIQQTPNLDWLLLTKRIGNVRMMAQNFIEHHPNVLLGATVVNQKEADRDIPKLLAVPAAKRFLSMEPLLGPVDLTAWLWGRGVPCATCPKDSDCECGYERRKLLGEPTIDWVIVGGESGPKARPMHPDWARSLRDQCQAAGVPFLFKQWGEWSPGYAKHGNDLSYDHLVDAAQHEWPEGHCAFRVGKKVAGRLLDYREWNEVPA